ncbi:unnamed protein product [Periconia digitata]|uniref:Uncharacterized protein n=1 Tax=Periconia digitata TaxID=1303443 RepID=A0A9W4XWA0_9PLEO|nr:unnamed protein product [Periconia digitata]
MWQKYHVDDHPLVTREGFQEKHINIDRFRAFGGKNNLWMRIILFEVSTCCMSTIDAYTTNPISFKYRKLPSTKATKEQQMTWNSLNQPAHWKTDPEARSNTSLDLQVTPETYETTLVTFDALPKSEYSSYSQTRTASLRGRCSGYWPKVHICGFEEGKHNRSDDQLFRTSSMLVEKTIGGAVSIDNVIPQLPDAINMENPTESDVRAIKTTLMHMEDVMNIVLKFSDSLGSQKSTTKPFLEGEKYRGYTTIANTVAELEKSLDSLPDSSEHIEFDQTFASSSLDKARKIATTLSMTSVKITSFINQQATDSMRSSTQNGEGTPQSRCSDIKEMKGNIDDTLALVATAAKTTWKALDRLTHVFASSNPGPVVVPDAKDVPSTDQVATAKETKSSHNLVLLLSPLVLYCIVVLSRLFPPSSCPQVTAPSITIIDLKIPPPDGSGENAPPIRLTRITSPYGEENSMGSESQGQRLYFSWITNRPDTERVALESPEEEEGLSAWDTLHFVGTESSTSGEDGNEGPMSAGRCYYYWIQHRNGTIVNGWWSGQCRADQKKLIREKRGKMH